MRFQTINDLAALCSRKGITNIVLCPGSRCAPLTLAFVRHGRFTIHTFSDERSAAFIALGISQQTNSPVILICTSGTSVYNFAPAIAEAYFNQVPLIVLSADRPKEWIGQQDGQTIYQASVFGPHVKKYFELPQDYHHEDSIWYVNRTVNEAINLTVQSPAGPVHINTPFREPLYPEQQQPTFTSFSARAIEEYSASPEIPSVIREEVLKKWAGYDKILMVAGQQEYNPVLHQTLNEFMTTENLPLVGDIISNMHPCEKVIRYADVFLGQAPEMVKENLHPDLLITFGKSVISKNIKLFLRNCTPQEHWHIQPAGEVADTFKHLTNIIRTSPLQFFQFILSHPSNGKNNRNEYSMRWEKEEQRANNHIVQFFPKPELGEFELVQQILKGLQGNKVINLHLANSMSVRYANFIGLFSHQRQVRVYANRGTSGIDGCTSTAVGHSLSGDELNVLITGDLAFFYDRNAFWHNYPLPNLRIVLLNNHGGAIFKMIDGPADLPEADDYFVTRQKLNAKKLCEEFGFVYYPVETREQLKNMLPAFLGSGNTVKVLEVETTPQQCKTILEEFKLNIKKSYDE